ncbi:anthranilate synthase component I family protein [Mucilaginibacter arboris]|uniref:Aminodeoxychorismate synthase component I n=1 Tax=Mucilaginibacter arboris TaxID=2682090 RepID=A0A7K1SU91_9SPHI|nr:anthranilate synthase component I family protein [Mucilaginibacter arboris]MVN20891.1 aminodeoxychorismate synthase component I [Mucilaginibacter arboris]
MFKRKALYWASSFNTACVFDSNGFADAYSKFDLMIAACAEDELEANIGTSFIDLKSFKKKHPKKWLPGFLSYDLNNEIEYLSSKNPDQLQFPDLYFFLPKHVLLLKENQLKIFSDQAEDVYNQIDQTTIPSSKQKPKVQIQARISKESYLQKAERIRRHIIRGDIYVTNFCQEFYAENAQIDPAFVFDQLNTVSPTPFACYFKAGNKYILSASPERFLAKRESKLISQPIKGTAPRSAFAAEDEHRKNILKNSIKEKSENVMIVDLVRNDLTKSAIAGTVKAEELFGIYSFTQVHQMISTITAALNQDVDVVDAIKNTFPAGSMTGAPKIKAMQLMEEFEGSKRSIYAGSAGYFSPDGDFDFNVVIRSILYNAANKYLSFQVGSAITFLADLEAEYEECLLKASAIIKVLGG